MMEEKLSALKRLAVINDISGVGKCSLTVMLPVVSATGVECSCLPTTVLSTHTSVFQGFTLRDLSEDIVPIAEHWAREKIPFDGICTGYMANAGQAEKISQAIQCLRGENTLVIVDPAMADNGHYYSMLGDPIRDAFRSLISRADIVTPNLTEAALLTGLPYMAPPHPEEYVERLLCALTERGSRIAVITSLCDDRGQVGCAALDRETGELCRCMHPACSGSFHGSGDLFTAAFSALLLRGASLRDAVETAGGYVYDSICRTARRDTPRHWGVDFEGAMPAYIRRVEALFS